MKQTSRILHLLILALILIASGCSSAKPQTKSPKEISDLYTDMGTAALMRDEYPQAVEDLRKAITVYPTNAIAHNHLGLAYYGLGQRDLAKKSVERATFEDPKYSDAYINLGNFAFQEGNNTLAKHYFNKALSNLEYKLRHRALTNLGQVALVENKYDEARKYFAESLVVNPDFCITHFLMGTLCSRENNTKCSAESFAKSTQKACAGNPEAHYQLALQYVKLKDYAKAKSQLMLLVEGYPQTVQAQKASDQLKYIP